MGDIQLIRFERVGGTYEQVTGLYALTYTFEPKPNNIEKNDTIEWYIRPVGHKLEPSATNRRRQQVQYKVSGSMPKSAFQYSGNPASPGLEDVLLDRSGAYAYAFVSDLEMSNFYDICAVDGANFRQTTKYIENLEPYIDYTISLTKIFHKPK